MKTRTEDRTVTFDFPLPRTHCGVALGNGNFGMLVWGGQRLHLTVNCADFWDHRHGEVVPEWASYERVKAALGAPDEREQMTWIFNDRQNPPPRWKSSRLPFGCFELEIAPGLAPRRAALDVATGCLRVEVAGGKATSFLSMAMDIKENLVAIRDPGGVLIRAHVRTAWEWAAEDLQLRGLSPSERISETDAEGWAQPLPADPALAALCLRVKEGCFIALARGQDVAAAQDAAMADARRAEAQGMARFFDRAAQWWRAFWRDVPEIEIPSDFLSRFYTYALYKFACATAPESPIAAGLQGPWAEEYQMTPWNGDYHFNVNVQQIYTLAFSINRPDHCLPLFDMLESEPFFSTMRQTAERLYGVDDGLALTHAVDDRGRQVGGLSAGSVIDHACGGWTAQLYWLYFRHTGDVEFLRRRAYPFLCGMMRSYEGMLEKSGGVYRIPVSISAEYRLTNARGEIINYGPNPSYQLACIHMLLDALFDACATLGIAPRAAWRDIKAHLPPYALIEGEEGPQIAVWEGQNLDVCHRHHSHLACLYPFDSLGDPTPETRAVVENAIDHWIAKGMGAWSEWCIPWAAILQARMGLSESPRILLEMWRELFINEGLATVYLPRFRGLTAHRRADTAKPRETHEIMQLDGTMAGATAILEMLVHTRGGTIHVFPAVSERWPDVAFRNVGVPGPARVSAERRGGRTICITVTSPKGGPIRLAVPDMPEVECVRGETRCRETLPLSLVLQPGETVTVRA